MKEQPQRQTVSEYAEAHCCSASTVRRSIESGWLKIEPKSKPTIIIGGTLRLTPDRWRKALIPAAAKLKKGTFGFEGADLSILKPDATILKIPYGETSFDLRLALSVIEELALHET